MRLKLYHEKREPQHHKSPTQVAIDESPIPDSEPITISKLPFENESPTPDPELLSESLVPLQSTHIFAWRRAEPQHKLW